MKLLLLLLVLLFAVWLWRSGRQAKQPPSRRRASPPAQAPLEMIACAQCGLHLPKADAVVGQHGLYCSIEHRQRAEP